MLRALLLLAQENWLHHLIFSLEAGCMLIGDLVASIYKTFQDILIKNCVCRFRHQLIKITLITNVFWRHSFWFYFSTSSLVPFSHLYDIIGLCYKNRKWHRGQGYFICESYRISFVVAISNVNTFLRFRH